MPSTTSDRQEAYVTAGLYDPATQAETGRLELLVWLSAKGFTIDEMVDALHEDRLGSMAGDRRLLPGARLSGSEAVAIAGVDQDRFDASVRALGIVPVIGSPEGEVGVTEDEARAIASVHVLGEMFSNAEAMSFLRVVGSSLNRIAEAGVSVFLADVESDLLTDGSSELVLARKVEEAIGMMSGFMSRLDPVFQRQMMQAIERTRRTAISGTERFKYRYAVGFVDLVGFTEIVGELEVRELASFLREFEARAYDVVTSAGAQVVKLIGDEVMFVSTDAGAACEAARELMVGFDADHEHVVPRGGLAYGDVLMRGGDYFGPVVNLASRLVNEAVPQELLVTEALADASDHCEFEAAGRRMVKGFADPIRVRSLVPSPLS